MGTVLFVRADEMRVDEMCVDEMRADEMCVDEMCVDECSDTFYAMPVICRQDLVVLADITF